MRHFRPSPTLSSLLTSGPSDRTRHNLRDCKCGESKDACCVREERLLHKSALSNAQLVECNHWSSQSLNGAGHPPSTCSCMGALHIWADCMGRLPPWVDGMGLIVSQSSLTSVPGPGSHQERCSQHLGRPEAQGGGPDDRFGPISSGIPQCCCPCWQC